MSIFTVKPKIKAPRVKVEPPKVKIPKPKVEVPKPKVVLPKPKVEVSTGSRAKGLEYDNTRRLSISKPKVEAPKLKVEPPKLKVEPPKVEPPKVKVEELASSRAIDDLKIVSKETGQNVKNITTDLAKASDTIRTTGKLDNKMWKFTDELGESGKVAKQIDETGSAIPKAADGSSMVKGKVEADEITLNLKKLEVDPPKNIDDAAVKIKNTSEDRLKWFDDELKKVGKKTKEFVSNNKKLVAGVTAAALIAGGIAIAAAVNEKKKTDTTYNIISIEDISTSNISLAKITFTPGEKMSKRDYLMFNGTNCDPPLPPDCEIYQIDSDFQVQVIIPQKLTRNGTSGSMKIKTSFSNQYTILLTDSVKEVANVAGESTGAIVEGAVDITKEVAVSFWESLGLPNLTEYWWVLLILCILFISSSFALIALVVMGKTE